MRLEGDEGRRALGGGAGAVDASTDAIGFMDLEGILTCVNLSFCRMWGFQNDREILGRPAGEFWSLPERAFDVRRIVVERASWAGEVQGRRKDGSLFDVHVSSSLVTDETGRPAAVMASFADTKSEKSLQDEPRQLGDFNARLLQVANVWIGVLDADGNVLVWNEEAERISGYSRSEVVGHDRIWEWIYPDPAYRAEVRRKRREALVQARPFWGDEATIRTRGGEERILSLYGGSFIGDDGRASALVMVAHDVTERRRSEQSLREYSMQVAQLYKEKTLFLSTLSHELRTPLTAIRGFADLLASENQLRPEALKMVERIKAQAERLDAFLQDLLAFSRGDFTRKGSPGCPADFARILDQVAEVLRPRLAAKGHHFSCEAGSDVGLMKADPDDLENVLTNILSNAISYTPPGGRVSVHLRKLNGFLQVEVTDNGIGVSPDERDRIFDEFYRTAAAKRMTKDGTGLGLSIVKRLVGGWGGAVWVTSPGDGQGSTVAFTVPLAQSSPGDDSP